MTFAQGSRIASLALPRARDRDVLIVFLVGLTVALCWQGVVLLLHSDVASVLLKSRTGFSAAELLAIGVMAFLVVRLSRDDVLSRSDLAVIAVSSLAFALPMRIAAFVPIAAVGAKLLFHRDARVRSIGQILVALAAYEWIGPLLFHLASPQILGIETSLAQATLAPLNAGFARDGLAISSPTWSGVVVEEGCSAFRNVSLATLIWISLVKLETLTMRPAYVAVAVAMAVTTVALNTIRIAMMAQSPQMYAYWHDGPGKPIVAFVMLAAVLGVCLGGMRWAARR